jgi:hypothetical protein
MKRFFLAAALLFASDAFAGGSIGGGTGLVDGGFIEISRTDFEAMTEKPMFLLGDRPAVVRAVDFMEKRMEAEILETKERIFLEVDRDRDE